MTRAGQPELRDVFVAGELVALRPVRRADAGAAFPLLFGREPILKWLVWKGPRDLAELEEAYADWILPSDNGTSYRLAVVARDDDSFCGSISVRFTDHPFVGDVGYWLAEERWGRGYATEANRLAAHLAFRHAAATTLVAEVFEGNDASARVLEKVGYEPSAEGADLLPLAEEPLEIDRPKELWVLGRRRFERLHAGWAPSEERVRINAGAR